MEAMPKTAPKMPWNLARSRGVARSAAMIMVSTITPPAPRPWKARKAMSWPIVWARPHRAELTRKTTMAVR